MHRDGLWEIHFRTFTFRGVGGTKRNVEHGGLVLFALTEMSKGLMCEDNLLSYVQLLQHKIICLVDDIPYIKQKLVSYFYGCT